MCWCYQLFAQLLQTGDITEFVVCFKIFKSSICIHRLMTNEVVASFDMNVMQHLSNVGGFWLKLKTGLTSEANSRLTLGSDVNPNKIFNQKATSVWCWMLTSVWRLSVASMHSSSSVVEGSRSGSVDPVGCSIASRQWKALSHRSVMKCHSVLISSLRHIILLYIDLTFFLVLGCVPHTAL